MKLPWVVKPGVQQTSGVLLTPRDSVSKPLLPIMGAKSLTELTDRFVFFTPATLYLARVVEGDMPWVDFCQQFAIDMPFYHFRFQNALFAGLEARDGDKDWNHVLWAIPRPAWPCFVAYAGSLTFMHAGPPAGQFDTTLLQDMRIRDVLALDNGLPSLTKIGCVAFVVTGSRFACAFTRMTEDGRYICRWVGPHPRAQEMYANILDGRNPLELPGG